MTRYTEGLQKPAFQMSSFPIEIHIMSNVLIFASHSQAYEKKDSNYSQGAWTKLSEGCQDVPAGFYLLQLRLIFIPPLDSPISKLADSHHV